MSGLTDNGTGTDGQVASRLGLKDGNRNGHGTGFRPLKNTPKRPGPHDVHGAVVQSDDERRLTVDEIRTGTCHCDLVRHTYINETRFILDDVRLALDDAGPERQGDCHIRAVDADVVIGRSGRVIARDASLDRIDAVPRRWRSR